MCATVKGPYLADTEVRSGGLPYATGCIMAKQGCGVAFLDPPMDQWLFHHHPPRRSPEPHAEILSGAGRGLTGHVWHALWGEARLWFPHWAFLRRSVLCLQRRARGLGRNLGAHHLASPRSCAWTSTVYVRQGLMFHGQRVPPSVACPRMRC